MENEILDLIDRYWKFDDNQQPVSNWHDKQDLLEAVRKALRIHDVVGRSEQLPCGHKQVELVRYAAKCKDCGTVFETKW
jgi:hypothetical protein